MTRALLRLATVLAVLLGCTVGSLAVAQAVETPETLADRRPVSAAPVVPPFAIEYLGVLWNTGTEDHDHGPQDHGPQDHGDVRFRSEGRWSDWQPLTNDGAHLEGQWASALVPAGSADAYQVRGVPADARAPRAVAMNTTDGPLQVVGSRPAGSAGAVSTCLSRAEWGADESLRFTAQGAESWPAEFHPVQTMTVHHTATRNGDPDPAATVRAIYRYHAVDRGWGDIGYHYLLDERGRVYEGRHSGATSVPCAQGGNGADFAHGSGDRLVTGAHTGGFNSGNVGAALLGNFDTAAADSADPAPVAVDALEALLAESAVRHGLDPRARRTYVNPVSGATRTVDTISGHRDWLATECPGERLYDDLPAIREAVAARTAPDEPEVPDGGGSTPVALDVPVSAGTDDAEERSSGTVRPTDSDLELTKDGSYVQTVGLRFARLSVPAGATITDAYVQFTADEVTTGAASLTVAGQAADTAAPFSTATRNVSARARTAATVAWQPAPWGKAGARAAEHRTPDLARVVQEVVARPGWVSGNALALVVTGTGTRTAEPYEGGTAKAPVLHVEYTIGTPTPAPVNTAPVVSAGPDLTLPEPGSATLTGSATDDGRPGPLSVTWSQVSGPAPATVSSPGDPATSASFPAPGTYALRLTATDGSLSTSDDVTVAVAAAPTGGTPTVLDIPVRTGADDAEERTGGTVQLTSGDLNLGQDGSSAQVVGLRFTGVTVPRGARITAASVRFMTDEAGSSTSSLTVAAQAANDPAAFTTAAASISTRPVTGARVTWTPGGWPAVGATHRTPDLAPVLQEMVLRSDWASGDPLVLVVTGAGERTAESFEGGSAKAPVLHVEYTQ